MRAANSEHLVSVILIGALAIPFWIPYHKNPIPSFYSEWAAITLGLVALLVFVLARPARSFALPFAAWIPLAMFPVVLIHLALAEPGYAFGPLFYLLYLSSALAMMLLGNALAGESRRLPLADVIAIGLLLGALGAAFALWTIRMKTGWLVGMYWSPEIGLISQRNHNALHLWLGVLAAGHLMLAGRIRPGFAVVGWLVLVEAATFSGSRSVYLYAAATLFLGLWAGWRGRRAGQSRAEARHLYFAGTAPVVLLFFLVLSSFAVRDATPQSVGAIARFAPSTVSHDGRIGHWLSASLISKANPILGAGPGSFMRQSWLASAELPAGTPNHLPTTHAHNLFFHLAAELGLPTTLAVAALLALWLMRLLRNDRSRGQWILLTVLAVVLAHNQVEYSFWYQFFLLPAALCAGALGIGAARAVRGRALGLIAACGLVLAALLANDYRDLEKLLRNPMTQIENARRLVAATDHPFWGPFASSMVAANFPVNDELLSEQLAHAERAMSVGPLPNTVPHRYAMLLEKAGREKEAETELEVANRIFPESWPIGKLPASATVDMR